MLKIFFILFLISHLSFSQKNNFRLTGEINGISVNQAKARILTLAINIDDIGFKLDSFEVSVINNKFCFEGYMPYPHAFYGLFISDPNKLNFGTSSFFVDSGNISVKINYDSTKQLLEPLIINSKTHNEYLTKFYPEYKKIEELQTRYLNNKYNFLPKKYGKNIPDSLTKLNRMLWDSMLINRVNYLKKYIKKNQKSYIPLAFIGQYLREGSSTITETKEIFNCLSNQLQNTISGIKIVSLFKELHIENKSQVLKGAKFINIVGDSVNIDFNKSKYTVIDYWFSYCKPCIAQLPDFKETYNLYKNDSIQFYSISIDEDKNEWLKSINDHKIAWLNLWDRNGDVAKKLLLNGYPTYMIIDRKGNVIRDYISISELSNFLGKIILK